MTTQQLADFPRTSFFFLIEDDRNPIQWNQPEDISLNDASEMLAVQDIRELSPHKYTYRGECTFHYGPLVTRLTGETTTGLASNPQELIKDELSLGGERSPLFTERPFVVFHDYQAFTAWYGFAFLTLLPLPFYLWRGYHSIFRHNTEAERETETPTSPGPGNADRSGPVA